MHERGIPYEVEKTWLHGVPADPGRFDWIVAMGSRYSVNDVDPDWIPAEVDFIGKAVAEALDGATKVMDAKKVEKALDKASKAKDADGKPFGDKLKKGEKPVS